MWASRAPWMRWWSRARYRRRYGNDMPEPSTASRFLEEIPQHLIEDLSSGRNRPASWGGYAADYTETPSRFGRGGDDFSNRHYSYEDEDQSASPSRQRPDFSARGRLVNAPSGARSAPPVKGDSVDNIARFFSGRGGVPPKTSRPKIDVPEPTGARGFRSGQRVRHPKYGEGVVFRREGEGEDAKISVQFARFGVKKLVEKFANLEKA